jgi:hypothetical protein
MSTGVSDPFQQSTGLFQVVLRKLGHIKWNVLRLVDRLKRRIKRKKGCEYWESPWNYCGGQVTLRDSMTAYHWKSGEPNPNRKFMCCDEHYEDYVEYWTEMWDEYYSSIGYPRKKYERRSNKPSS